jgi:hypothetical protein
VVSGGWLLSALKSQSKIWFAVSVYVLVAIIKKRLNLDASLYTLLQILSGNQGDSSGQTRAYCPGISHGTFAASLRHGLWPVPSDLSESNANLRVCVQKSFPVGAIQLRLAQKTVAIFVQIAELLVQIRVSWKRPLQFF